MPVARCREQNRPETLSQTVRNEFKPENVIASIGPHIRVGAFEVSEEVALLIITPRPGLTSRVARLVSGRGFR